MDSQAIRITPKGALCLALDGNIALTEKAWEALRFTAHQQACKEEFDIPAIVFEGGGKSISVKRTPTSP
jgi:hypothetical protein